MPVSHPLDPVRPNQRPFLFSFFSPSSLLWTCSRSTENALDRFRVSFSTPLRLAFAFWKCVRSIVVANFYWLFLKDCAAKRRESMCLSKSGRYEVCDWGLPATQKSRSDSGRSSEMSMSLWVRRTATGHQCISSPWRNFCITFDFTMWRRQASFLILPTLCLLGGQELV